MKKNRVVASITIHVTESGTYKVNETVGELRRNRHDLTWTQAQRAIKEFRAMTARVDADVEQKAAGDAHIQAVQSALKMCFPTFQLPPNGMADREIEWNPAETFTIGSVSGPPLVIKGFWLKP